MHFWVSGVQISNSHDGIRVSNLIFMLHIFFPDWHPHLTEADDHLLVQAGRDEMKVLGERFRARLPSLFETFDNKEVIVSVFDQRKPPPA